MFYNARWYDPSLGRFAQADNIVPSPVHSQSWDRYSYANNNPINYTDPSGHVPVEGCDDGKGKCHGTALEIARNAQHLAILERDMHDRMCAGGNTAYCSGDPVEIIAFTGIMLTGGALAETFVLR